MEWNSLMDFLEKTIKEQELLNISYKQSKQNKADRHLESFSDDLRNSINKAIKAKPMIRQYTYEEEEILRKGLEESELSEEQLKELEQ